MTEQERRTRALRDAVALCPTATVQTQWAIAVWLYNGTVRGS